MLWPAATLRSMPGACGRDHTDHPIALRALDSSAAMPVYEFKCPRHGSFFKTATWDKLIARCSACQRSSPRASDQPTNKKSRRAVARVKLRRRPSA
jgi:hypothetical protein